MKKIIAFIIILASLTLCIVGCGKFDPAKEDLSKYVTLDFDKLTYDEVNADYQAFRESCAVTTKDATFTPDWGYTIDFSLKAEVYNEVSEDLYSYITYPEWTKEVKAYDIYKTIEHKMFDYGIAYDLERAENVDVRSGIQRTITIGTPFSFTIDIGENDDPVIANHTVKFTLTVTKAVPANYTDSYIADTLTSFFEEVGYYKDSAEYGDFVMVDIDKVQIDGEDSEVEFPNGTISSKYESYNNGITLGDGYLWEEAEKALLGHAVNDSVEISIPFASDYTDEALAGKTLTFTAKVKIVYNYIWTIQKNTDFETAWELKNALRVLAHADLYAMDIIADKAEIIKYPSQILTMYKKYYKAETESMIQQVYDEEYNIVNVPDKKEIETRLYPDGVDKYIEDNAKYQTVTSLVSSVLIKKYNINYTNAQYNAFIQELIETYKASNNITLTKKQVIEMYTETYIESELYRTIINTTVISEMEGKPTIPLFDGK